MTFAWRMFTVWTGLCRTGVVSSSGSDSGDVEDAATKWVFFEVADTGIGIGPKGLKSLFKEFVQVHTSSSLGEEMPRPRDGAMTAFLILQIQSEIENRHEHQMGYSGWSSFF